MIKLQFTCTDWDIDMSIERAANKLTPRRKHTFAGDPTLRDGRAWLQDYVTVSVPRPSFLLGLASLWDFGGALTPRVRVNRKMLDQSDADALAADWEALADDLARILPPVEQYDAFE